MFGNAKQSFEVFSNPDHITAIAARDIPGNRFVRLVAGGTARVPKVELCTAGERPFGVSAFSAVAGEKLTIHRKGVWTVDAAANLVAPALITSNATGQAVAFVAATAPAKDPFVAGQIYTDAKINSDAAVVLALSS